jgi:uncharacterized membrane protein (DUF4010 family)
MEFLDFIPEKLWQFLLVTLFSLIIGLALRRLHSAKEEFRVFGTDRTFTFIGILGFLLYIFDPETMIPYLGGGLVIAALLGVYYHRKMHDHQEYGLTTIVVAFITYCIPPLVITQPAWLYILVVVTVLIFTEMKGSFVQMSRKFDKDEFVTLAKFLAIAGVILPIVPNEPIVPFLPLTPFKIWVAVVVISGVSYASYLLRKFVFTDSGILISGLLGGLYSSTATTIILARKGKEDQAQMPLYGSGIILSIAMMYLRILILMFIFNSSLALAMLPAFLVLIGVSAGTGIFFFFRSRGHQGGEKEGPIVDKNPLEFKVAIIFTLLFVSLSFITHFVVDSFGARGLNVLSWIVGVTDIDPFLLNLFQGLFDVPLNLIGLAVMQAIISNNIMKGIYAAVIAGGTLRRIALTGIGIISLVNGLIALLMI